MKTNLNTNQQPIFQAKVSPRFVNMMQSYINNGENRLKNNYRLNTKLEEITQNFGYDNHTIELVTNFNSLGRTYTMLAVKDDSKQNNGIFIIQRPTFKKLLEAFFNLRKNYFIYKMKRNSKFEI